MSYNPTNWQTGDTVTAEKLNKLESGVENAQLPAVTGSDNGDVLAVVDGEWAKAEPPSGLPAVTGDDNGDVLTVVEGAWAKAQPDSGYLKISQSFNETLETNILNKTWLEIDTALKSGKYCSIVDILEDFVQVYQIVQSYSIPVGLGGGYELLAFYMDSSTSDIADTRIVYHSDTVDGYPQALLN